MDLQVDSQVPTHPSCPRKDTTIDLRTTSKRGLDRSTINLGPSQSAAPPKGPQGLDELTCSPTTYGPPARSRVTDGSLCPSFLRPPRLSGPLDGRDWCPAATRGLVIGNLQTLPQASSYAGRLESEAAVSWGLEVGEQLTSIPCLTSPRPGPPFPFLALCPTVDLGPAAIVKATEVDRPTFPSKSDLPTYRRKSSLAP